LLLIPPPPTFEDVGGGMQFMPSLKIKDPSAEMVAVAPVMSRVFPTMVPSATPAPSLHARDKRQPVCEMTQVTAAAPSTLGAPVAAETERQVEPAANTKHEEFAAPSTPAVSEGSLAGLPASAAPSSAFPETAKPRRSMLAARTRHLIIISDNSVFRFSFFFFHLFGEKSVVRAKKEELRGAKRSLRTDVAVI
jgi:hypothetical protein